MSRLSIGSACRTEAKPSAGAAADALGRRIGGDEIGMIALEILQLAQERVELGVGDLRVLVDVVALFVMADLLAKLFDAGGGIHGSLKARI